MQYDAEIEQLRAVTGAEAAQSVLSSFFMQCPLPMCVLHGPEYKFTLANSHYEEFVGRKVFGKTVAEAFTPEEVKDYVPLLDRVYHTGEPYIGKEAPFDLPAPGGGTQRHWVNFGYHPFRNPKGEIEGLIAIVNDITELVEARKKIELSEKHHRDYIEAMPQIAFISEPEGDVTYFNQRWYDYIGNLPGSKNWGWKDLGILHPDDLERTIVRWKHSLETGEPYETEYRLRRHDGQYRWHLGRAVAIRDKDGRIYRWVGTNTDIHEQRELLRKFQDAQELRDRFVSMLTHDLRTPLTAARMGAQVIARKPEDTLTVQRVSSRIVNSIDRADRMIRDLLDVNRIGAGEPLPLDLETCQLNELVVATLDELSTIHGDRFVLNAPDRVFGQWDPRALTRITENLVSNAVKYGAPNRPIEISVTRQGSEVLLEVHNEGAAIPESEQHTLFEPFRRAELAVSGSQKGWGLGLTLVRGIAEAHGGTTGVHSTAADGTTFWVRIPIQAGHSPGLKTARPADHLDGQKLV